MPDKNDMADEQLSSESDEDWKAKYEEVYEMLTETEAELKEFQVSSKELEDEMALDVERAEKAREDMQNKLARTEGERDDWKGKFMSLQSTHTTTVNSLQRELEALRESHKLVKIQLRELEMGNDDLERHERAVVSSLEDLEAKYSRALEEKILLEHELQDKASMEEDMQRLRDELRDAVNEASVLRDQLEKAHADAQVSPRLDEFSVASPAVSATESLLDAPLPPASDELLLNTPTNERPSSPMKKLTPILPELTIPNNIHSGAMSPPPTGMRIGSLARSTLASPSTISPSRLPAPSPRRLISSSTAPHLPSSLTASSSTINPAVANVAGRVPRLASAASTNSLVTRSKGMQMVSDMRSRVKVLEQRIQNRVPRMRKDTATSSTTATAAATTASSSTTAQAHITSPRGPGLVGSTARGGAGTASSAAAAMAARMAQRDREREREKEKRASTTTSASTSNTDGDDSPGWVLVSTTDKEATVRTSTSSARSATSATSGLSATSSSTNGGAVLVSPTSSAQGSARHPVAHGPPSAYHRTASAAARSSGEMSDTGGGGHGMLGVSSSSGLRPPSGLGLRRSIGPGDALLSSSTATARPITPSSSLPLPSAGGYSSSTSTASSSASSSTAGLRRSTSTKKDGATNGPARRSSLGASTTLGQSTARPRAMLAGAAAANGGSIPTGSVRSRPPSSAMPSRPAIPSMQPPVAPLNLRGPSPIPGSGSSGIPQRPRSNVGMARKDALMSPTGGALGKSMIGRPTSLQGAARAPRKSSNATAGDEYY